jgi:pyruvate/2-oxoglutarate dehydrogenase complex dihydrolipoamide acyltransferase (E2) component
MRRVCPLSVSVTCGPASGGADGVADAGIAGALGAAVGAEVEVGGGLVVNSIEGEASEPGEIATGADAVGPAVGDSDGEPPPPPTQAASMRLEPARSPASPAPGLQRFFMCSVPQVAPMVYALAPTPEASEEFRGQAF